MSKLCYEAQLKEIRGSFASLDEIINSNFKTYCHPYGAHYDFNINTIDLLNKLNIDYSFMVDPREITEKDFKFSRQNLPRYDCNKFKYGEVS